LAAHALPRNENGPALPADDPSVDEHALLSKLGDVETQVALDGSHNGLKIHCSCQLQGVGITETVATDSATRIRLPRQDGVEDINDSLLRPLRTGRQGSQGSFQRLRAVGTQSNPNAVRRVRRSYRPA